MQYVMRSMLLHNAYMWACLIPLNARNHPQVSLVEFHSTFSKALHYHNKALKLLTHGLTAARSFSLRATRQQVNPSTSITGSPFMRATWWGNGGALGGAVEVFEGKYVLRLFSQTNPSPDTRPRLLVSK